MKKNKIVFGLLWLVLSISLFNVNVSAESFLRDSDKIHYLGFSIDIPSNPNNLKYESIWYNSYKKELYFIRSSNKFLYVKNKNSFCSSEDGTDGDIYIYKDNKLIDTITSNTIQCNLYLDSNYDINSPLLSTKSGKHYVDTECVNDNSFGSNYKYHIKFSSFVDSKNYNIDVWSSEPMSSDYTGHIVNSRDFYYSVYDGEWSEYKKGYSSTLLRRYQISNIISINYDMPVYGVNYVTANEIFSNDISRENLSEVIDNVGNNSSIDYKSSNDSINKSSGICVTSDKNNINFGKANMLLHNVCSFNLIVESSECYSISVYSDIVYDNVSGSKINFYINDNGNKLLIPTDSSNPLVLNPLEISGEHRYSYILELQDGSIVSPGVYDSQLHFKIESIMN